MATHNPNGLVVRNDGGTIVKAGNTDGSVVSALTLVELAQDRVVAPVTILEVGAAVKALSGGTFAYTPAKGEEFLMRSAGPNATTINGTDSDILEVGGRFNVDAFDGINELNSTRDTDGDLVAFGNDNAAGPVEPSRSVPGELTYMFGGKAPQTSAYKAKDTAEA